MPSPMLVHCQDTGDNNLDDIIADLFFDGALQGPLPYLMALLFTIAMTMARLSTGWHESILQTMPELGRCGPYDKDEQSNGEFEEDG